MEPVHSSRTWRWLLWAALLACWTVLLLVPEPPSPSGSLGEFIAGRKFLISKTIHVTAYAFFGILTAWLHAPARYRWLLVYLLMAHAGLTELIQLNFSSRSGSLRDMALNFLGIFLGILASWKWWTEET